MLVPAEAYPNLAASLPDSPRTVHALHFLRTGRCTLFADAPCAPANLALRLHLTRPLTLVWGQDPQVMAALVGEAGVEHPFWVSEENADVLQNAVEARFGVRLTRDLAEQKTACSAPAVPTVPGGYTVRRLDPSDLGALLHLHEDLVWTGEPWGSWEEALTRGLVVGALDGTKIVSIAVAACRSALHDDIAVATLAEVRGRGLCTACSALLMAEILAGGRTPVWTVSTSNQASVRVSEKLGFVTRFRAVGFTTTTAA